MANDVDRSTRGLAERIKHEVREVVPPTIFFFIAFHLLTISRALMLREHGVKISAVAGATVGALLVAKVVLIADALPGVNRFPEKPLTFRRRLRNVSVPAGAPCPLKQRSLVHQFVAETVAARQIRRAPLSILSATIAAPIRSRHASAKAAP